jgi:hypothetical protein
LVDDSAALSQLVASTPVSKEVNNEQLTATELLLASTVQPDFWGEPGSEETWNSGTTPPTLIIGQSGDSLGGTTFQTPVGDGFSIGAFGNGTFGVTWEKDYDFNKISAVDIKTRNSRSGCKITVRVGGSSILTYTSTGTTTHTIGVSQTGVQTLEIRLLGTSVNGSKQLEAGVLQFN